MSETINKYDKTLWTYKKVEDDDLSNKNLEVIISFFDNNKFELNINKFFSKFDIIILNESYKINIEKTSFELVLISLMEGIISRNCILISINYFYFFNY